ncbi:MAG: ATP-binding protein [Parachlamydiales bacterium]|nr:ATP-binding protein [Parachlamydiales bacterium]
MKRNHSLFLINWLNSSSRKPLVIRGARQVGKTWLIRNLAESTKRQLVELNFEKQPNLESLFSSNQPEEIIANISASFNRTIELTNTILFLDEIQATPHLLAKLRWFAEEMPELPVVAAGSLLDFSLADHKFSMPVGRISYMYLEPLSFEEFLEAIGQNELKKYLKNYHLQSTIPTAIHTQLMSIVKEYLIIGGMPTAVSAWTSQKNPEVINQIHVDLLATYRNDFAKYRGRLSTERLEDILTSIPRQLGKKFVYSHANPDVNTPPLKQALELLDKARFCHRIFATSANDLPLKAEIKENFFKVILLDCGLISAELGLSLYQLKSVSELILINSGGLAEQLVGQQLRNLFPAFVSPSLNYWQRSESGANAEVDYVIQHKNIIVPVEVKAGSTGTLKSLHQFMESKKRNFAVRINSDYPIIGPVEVKTSQGLPVKYTLLSIPFYLTEQLPRLIEESGNISNTL